MVLDRYGRAHQWFPADGLDACHDAGARARRIEEAGDQAREAADALNRGGASRERELRKAGL